MRLQKKEIGKYYTDENFIYFDDVKINRKTLSFQKYSSFRGECKAYENIDEFKKNFDLNGYTFYNPQGADSVLEKLTLEASATIKAQNSSFPLDGSNFGGISFDIGLKGLHFESMEANIVQEILEINI